MMDTKTVLVVCVLMLGMCISTRARPADVPHGYCRIVWLIGLPCNDIDAAIEAQINYLSTYQLVSTAPGEMEAKHTSYTGETQMVHFRMTPGFEGQGCHLEGNSVSLSWEKESDNANDYCNLQSLIQRSGVNNAPGFLEFANRGLCPGYKQSICI